MQKKILFRRASERRVHLHTFSSSHLLICSSSHLLIFPFSLTPSHLHIFSFDIFSSSHLLSHRLIFTPSLTPSHLHICLFHIFSSSYLLIFTPAPLHICWSSHLLSHLLIFTPLSHTFASSHPLSLSLPLSLSPLSSLLSLSSFSLPFLSLAFFIFLSLGRGWCRRYVPRSNPFERIEGLGKAMDSGWQARWCRRAAWMWVEAGLEAKGPIVPGVGSSPVFLRSCWRSCAS